MMASANLPAQADLNGLYGAWNPMSYMQGFQNQGLADQFRQQAFDENANTVKKGQLENDQAALMNPLLAADQQYRNTGRKLENTGKETANKEAALTYDNKYNLNQDYLAQQHAALKTKLSDEEMAQASNKVWKQYMAAIESGNVKDIQHAAEMLQIVTGPAASTAADRVQAGRLGELKLATSQSEGVLDRASAERIATIRKPIGKAAVSPDQIAAKLGYEKGAAFYLIKAEEADTPEEKQHYLGLASKFEQLNKQARAAGATANKPDMGAMGVPVVPQTNVINPNAVSPVDQQREDLRAALRAQGN